MILIGCDGHTTAGGKVVDLNGKPIENVTVRLIAPDVDPAMITNREVITDQDGAFDLAITHAPMEMKFRIEAHKAGYQSYEKNFTSRSDSFDSLVITLKPEEE